MEIYAKLIIYNLVRVNENQSILKHPDIYTTASPFEHHASSLQGVQSTDSGVIANICDNRNSYI